MTNDPSILQGVYFDQKSLDIDLQFFESLTLTKSTKSGRPEPLVLLAPHKKLVSNLLGWKRADGTRLYRRAYYSLARKNAKSTLCAALALYFLLMDAEQKPEIYLVAKTRDQASIVYQAAVDFINASPELRALLKVTPYSKQIMNQMNGGVIKALSGEGKQQHGKNPSVVIFDELHTFDSSEQELYDAMTTGSGARKQPTFIYITTAGVNENSICGREYAYAKKLLKGLAHDPAYLPLIYELEKTDDWRDEKNWSKANPCLGDIVSIESMREMRDKALNSPLEATAFKRLQCNMWVESADTWIPLHKWDLCQWAGEIIGTQKPSDIPDHVTRDPTGKMFLGMLKAYDCYAGLDLSANQDLTAVVLTWHIDDKIYTYPWFFLPADDIAERSKHDGVPYDAWSQAGYIDLIAGSTIDSRYITQRIGDLKSVFKIKEVGFDAWGTREVVRDLALHGLTCVDIGQGIGSLTAPSKRLEELVLSKKLVHTGHPILRWNCDCTSVKPDANNNIKPLKPDSRKSSKRIDGIVALIMALSRVQRVPAKFKSIYSTRGIRTL